MIRKLLRQWLAAPRLPRNQIIHIINARLDREYAKADPDRERIRKLAMARQRAKSGWPWLIRLPLVGGVAVLLVGSPVPAQAQLFGGTCVTADGPCASIPNQLIEIAKDIEIIVQTTITAVQEVLNTTPLGGMQFQDLTAEIQQLTQLVQQADLLAGNPGAFIGNLTAPYYPLPPNGMQQTITEQNTIGTAIQQLGNVIDTVNPSLVQRAATLASLTTEALAAIGRMQNQQDTHQALVTTGQDIHALTTLEMAMAQSHHSELLAKHDQEAMNKAWADQMATAYTPLSGGNAPGY